MAIKSEQELLDSSIEVRDEDVELQNTAARVGTLFADMVETLFSQIEGLVTGQDLADAIAGIGGNPADYIHITTPTYEVLNGVSGQTLYINASGPCVLDFSAVDDPLFFVDILVAPTDEFSVFTNSAEFSPSGSFFPAETITLKEKWSTRVYWDAYHAALNTKISPSSRAMGTLRVAPVEGVYSVSEEQQYSHLLLLEAGVGNVLNVLSSAVPVDEKIWVLNTSGQDVSIQTNLTFLNANVSAIPDGGLAFIVRTSATDLNAYVFGVDVLQVELLSSGDSPYLLKDKDRGRLFEVSTVDGEFVFNFDPTANQANWNAAFTAVGVNNIRFIPTGALKNLENTDVNLCTSGKAVAIYRTLDNSFRMIGDGVGVTGSPTPVDFVVAPTSNDIVETGFDVSVESDSDATAYWGVYTNNAPVPNYDNIKNGTGTGYLVHGSEGVVADVPEDINVTGRTGSTPYDFYVFLEKADTTKSSIVKVDVTTASAGGANNLEILSGSVDSIAITVNDRDTDPWEMNYDLAATADDALYVVAVGRGPGGTTLPVGVTCGGEAMTEFIRCGTDSASGERYTGVWKLAFADLPSLGTNLIKVTESSTTPVNDRQLFAFVAKDSIQAYATLVNFPGQDTTGPDQKYRITSGATSHEFTLGSQTGNYLAISVFTHRVTGTLTSPGNDVLAIEENGESNTIIASVEGTDSAPTIRSQSTVAGGLQHLMFVIAAA